MNEGHGPNSSSPRRIDVFALRSEGRAPQTPFALALEEKGEVQITRLLRVLPGKRIVGEATWQGQRVLAKIFVAEHAARHWMKEKNGIERLQKGGVPTPEILFAGFVGEGGYVLMTRFLDAVQSLAQRWLGVASLRAGHPEALDLLRPAFALLGQLHSSGLLHADLHFGNFLVGDGHYWLIDGDAVQRVSSAPSLAGRQIVRNLALMLAQLPIAWDESREALLTSYCATAGRTELDLNTLADEVERARNWRLSDYLKKTGRDCSLFSVSHNAMRFAVVRRDEGEVLQVLLGDPDHAIAGGDLLKGGRTSTVARVDQGGRSLVIKRYNLKNFMHAMSRCWRRSRAWHSWREGHRLRFFGIATPAPLALIEERIGPFRRRAFLINEYCPGVDLLSLLSADQVPAPQIAGSLVALFSTLCRLKISHGDLKATNLLWHEGQVVVIDLDALRQHRSAVSYTRAWRRDRARLLRNWPEGSALYAWLDANLPAVRA